MDLPHLDLILYIDASDSGWGASLGSKHLSGWWSQCCSLFSINHRELLAIFLAVDGFLPLLRRQSVALFTDNTSALSYLRKEGGTRSSTLNTVAQAILHLREDHSVRFLPQFIPRQLNVMADSLSQSSQVLGSEWTLCQEVCQELFRIFATSLNHQLQVYFSPVVDPQAAGTDAMLQPWDHLQAYAFPPFGLLLAMVRLSRGLEMTGGSVVAATEAVVSRSAGAAGGGSGPSAFAEGSTQTVTFPPLHLNLPALQLTGYHIASDPPVISACQLTRTCRSSTQDNYQAKWVSYRDWCHRHGHTFHSLPSLRLPISLYIFVVLSNSPTPPLPLTVICLVLSFALFFLTFPLTLSFVICFAPST